MNLLTTVDLPEIPFKINHYDKTIFIGSCFSTEIGNKFLRSGYSTLINPFGTVYNPATIAYQLDILTDFNRDDLNILEREGKYIFFDGNTEFTSSSKKELIDKIEKKTKEFKNYLLEAKTCFITFGSAKVYQHEFNGEIVANCHKLPKKEFEEGMLLSDAVSSLIMVSYDALKKINPMLDIVFTVSPVRYKADGLVNNTRSKASLHLGIATALPECEDAYYFPSYEIIIDELRDYRFYRDDFTHVNELGLNYVWKKVTTTFLNESDENARNQVIKFRKLRDHVVIGDLKQQQLHQQKIQEKLDALINEYPHLEMLNEN